MVRSENLYEYVNVLERILSSAYKYSYSTNMVEKEVSYSSFFQMIEKEKYGYSPITTDVEIIQKIFNDPTIDLNNVLVYNQCLWTAESYIRIQQETGMTFEAIFLYIPIKKMYEYFDTFHEMDFSQIIGEFKRLVSLESILSILRSNYGYSLSYVADKTGISYDTLFSYKQRRRDIKKMNAADAARLASFLRVRIETLLELSI